MKIKVGYVDVPVRVLPALHADEAEMDAVYRLPTNEIAIRTDRSSQEQARFLIHELLHAIFDIFALKVPTDEEDMVEQLDGPLAMVIRDNPALLGVLHQALCNGKPILPTVKGKA